MNSIQLRRHVIKEISELLNISEANAEVVMEGAIIIISVIEAVDLDLYNKIKQVLLNDNNKT